MTFEQAIAAAQSLHLLAPACVVIAIGRFVPSEQITPASPWKLSVLVDGRRQVIESQAECDRIIQAAKLTPSGMLF